MLLRAGLVAAAAASLVVVGISLGYLLADEVDRLIAGGRR